MGKQILVLGIVSPLGTNIDKFQNKTKRFLKKRYGAEVHSVTLSELIYINFADELKSNEFLKKSRIEKLKRKIELGNQIRKDYKKQDIFGEFALLKVTDAYKTIVTSTVEKHFVFVDQLKRPEEVKFLEQVFGQSFWLLGVNAPIENRIQTLSDSDEEREKAAEQLVYVDENEESNEYGQRMRKAFLLSHAVFSDEFVEAEATRFFDLLHGSHLVLPTPEEYFMNLAFGASLKSGDLSRQVGAVIVSKDQDQVSSGANEVNKFGGGNYWQTEQTHNDLARKYDPNKQVIKEIKDELKDRISKSGLAGMDAEGIAGLLDKSKLDDLTEFHRATHAEMDAILSAHRNGVKVVGATIYCTTFPCHNCAKHVVSAGISRIVFQEPYPKSLALRLHDDSISKKPSKGKVLLSEFQGITHMRFNELFSMTYSMGSEIKRKNDELVKPFDPTASTFRFHVIGPIFSRLSSIALETFNENGTIRLGKIA